MDAKLPSRVSNLARARRLYGSRADFYVGFLDKGDPLADAVVEAFEELPPGRGQTQLQRALAHGIGAVPEAPAALRELFAQIDDVPEWVDWDVLRLGARTYQRTGVAGSLILSSFSLMNGYHSHAATKPLVFTGQLDRMARRRLAETGHFIRETTQVDGLRRFRDGFATTVKVRIVHAHVRRHLRTSDFWDAAAWGLPINQADMAATNLAFSAAVLHGTRLMGLRFTPEEADAVIQLWRYSGYLSGIDTGLLCTCDREAYEWAELVDLVQPGPDEGSRRLADALRNVTFERAVTPFQRAVAEVLACYHDGLTRAVAGDEVADDLGIGNAHWKHAITLTRALVTPLEMLRESLPGATWLSSLAGNYVWTQAVAQELGGKAPQFARPPRPRLAS